MPDFVSESIFLNVFKRVRAVTGKFEVQPDDLRIFNSLSTGLCLMPNSVTHSDKLPLNEEHIAASNSFSDSDERAICVSIMSHVYS